VAVVDAVRETTEAGLNPRVAARRVRDTLGLGERDAELVARVRADLSSGDPARLRGHLTRKLRDKRSDRAVERAASGGAPLTPVEVERQTAAYERRLRARRAEDAARTVALDAAKRGQDAVLAQAEVDGLVPRGSVTVEWRTAGDAQVRTQHARMNRRRVLRGERFRDPATGDTWEYPGQNSWNCRCVGSVRVHATAEIARQYVREGR
jgi:hypothetical protein